MKFSRVKTFLAKHERRLSWAALGTGFIVDNLTLSRIDLWLDNIILSSYLFLSGGCIVLFHYLKDSSKIRLFLPYVLQYAFGGLFSGFIIFYSKSGSIIQSWPFLIILLFLLIGNETFKARYEKYIFRTTIYFIALFSFFIFFIPVMLGNMGSFVFILSGLISLLVIYFVVRLIEKSNKTRAEDKRKQIITSIASIYLLFNILYFTNAIPPIPLSLKNIDIYNSVEKIGDDYIVKKEKESWYEFYKKDTIHILPGENVYGFASVFAPTRLEKKIVHIWLYENNDAWEVRSKISFPISGGRDGGYRGYTFKNSPPEGNWILEIRTDTDQLIGRKKFYIKHEITHRELTTSTK